MTFCYIGKPRLHLDNNRRFLPNLASNLCAYSFALCAVMFVLFLAVVCALLSYATESGWAFITAPSKFLARPKGSNVVLPAVASPESASASSGLCHFQQLDSDSILKIASSLSLTDLLNLRLVNKQSYLALDYKGWRYLLAKHNFDKNMEQDETPALLYIKRLRAGKDVRPGSGDTVRELIQCFSYCYHQHSFRVTEIGDELDYTLLSGDAEHMLPRDWLYLHIPFEDVPPGCYDLHVSILNVEGSHSFDVHVIVNRQLIGTFATGVRTPGPGGPSVDNITLHFRLGGSCCGPLHVMLIDESKQSKPRLVATSKFMRLERTLQVSYPCPYVPRRDLRT